MRFLAIVFALGMTAVPAPAQEAAGTWSALIASPSHAYRFEDGTFLDSDTGWIVNPSGEVWGTTDGGASWDLLEQLPAYLRSTVFVNDQHGFIGTLNASNVLYESTNGGETFTDISDRISGPSPSGVCGLWAVNEDVIYGVGWYAGPAHFVKTTDGGKTWTSRAMAEYVGSLVDVYFWDEQRGIAVGGSNATGSNSHAVVLLTEDGGETWTVQHTSSESIEWSWKITFPTPTTGYVSVEGNGFPAKVLKTTDAGVTWTELAIPNSQDLQGLGFITENIGWASGRGTTSLTTDGGETWVQISLDGDINRFEFFGDTLGYAMGHQIYRYTPPAATGTEDGDPRSDFAVTSSFPNPFASATTIRYQTDTAADVELAVYDVLGRRVATLARGLRPAGAHEATWDGRDQDGRVLASGVYLVRLTAGDRAATRRVTLLR